MTAADDWADRYAELKYLSPANPVAWIGIPVLISSLVGMLWAAPVPEIFRLTSPGINWGTLFLMAAFVYYCVLSIRLGLAALPLLILTALPSAWIDQAGVALWPIASASFAPAFAWQLAESKHCSGRVLLLRNVQYLMMGPIWLLRAAFRRCGLGY